MSASGLEPVGGATLDGRLIELQPEVPPPAIAGHRWRRLLEWTGTSAPVAVLLLAGMALGPNGVALLSADTLALLAPAVPVAVALLGVLVVFSVALGRAEKRRLVLPACLDAALTTVVVAGGMATLALDGSATSTRSWLILVAGAGVCAASSLTLATGNPLEPRPAAVRVVELGALAPIVLGTVLLAWIDAGAAVPAAKAIAQATGLIGALALAGWLVLTVTSNETEARVLTVSALLLVGGVSDALSASALFGGVVAGALWRYAGRRPLESIGRDVLFVHHPLIVSLLLIAGASAELSRTTLVHGAAYVVCRVLGRLCGVAVLRRTSGDLRSARLTPSMLPPGVFGVAFALNLAAILGSDAATLLGTVVLGTMGAELVAVVLATPRTAE